MVSSLLPVPAVRSRSLTAGRHAQNSLCILESHCWETCRELVVAVKACSEFTIRGFNPFLEKTKSTACFCPLVPFRMGANISTTGVWNCGSDVAWGNIDKALWVWVSCWKTQVPLFAESVIEAQFTVFQVELLYLNKLPLGSLLACDESSEFWWNGLLDTWGGLQWFCPWKTKCPPSWSFLLSPLSLALVGLFLCGLWQWLADEEVNCLNRDYQLHGSWYVQINFRGDSWRSRNWLSENIWFCELHLKITFKPVSMEGWRP